MNLRDLEIFCEIGVAGNVSKAAKKFSISQPAASEVVKNLEKHLGTALLDRGKRPLELTVAGKIYFDGCRELLDSLRRLEDRVQQVNDKVVGPVHVASIYSVGLLQMDCYVKQFEHLYPDAVLELKYLHPDKVIAKVLGDEADLGLISFPKKNSELTIIPWQNQTIVAVVCPGHRLAGRRSMQVSELSGEDTVAFTTELQIRQEVDRWLKQAHVQVNITHEFDNIETIKRAVEVGSGIALLPIPTVRREIEIGSLRAVTLEDVDWARPLGIIHKRQKTLTAAATRFLDLLQQNPDSFFHPPQGLSAGRKEKPGEGDR